MVSSGTSPSLWAPHMGNYTCYSGAQLSDPILLPTANGYLSRVPSSQVSKSSQEHQSTLQSGQEPELWLCTQLPQHTAMRVNRFWLGLDYERQQLHRVALIQTHSIMRCRGTHEEAITNSPSLVPSIFHQRSLHMISRETQEGLRQLAQALCSVALVPSPLFHIVSWFSSGSALCHLLCLDPNQCYWKCCLLLPCFPWDKGQAVVLQQLLGRDEFQIQIKGSQIHKSIEKLVTPLTMSSCSYQI